jgi:signal transduction histidine kinase
VEKDYGEVPFVNVDETQIQQVFLNVLVNAGQALGEKGSIRIRTRAESGQASISISDDGPGIDPENLKHIFEPFFTTKPVGQGIGLGLHICYQIIRAHQGDIQARPRDGQGAEFLVTLPLTTSG